MNRRDPLLRTRSGYTLIEVIIALGIITVVVLALIQGMLSSTSATVAASRNQRLNTASTSYTESLKQLQYRACASPSWYTAKYQDMVAGGAGRFGTEDLEVSVVEVRYWAPGSFPANAPASPGRFTDGCENDAGAQLLTFEVQDPVADSTGQKVRFRGDVVLRDDSPGAAVLLSPTTTLAGANLRPLARIEGTPFVGSSPLAVGFSGLASEDADGSIVGYEWSFGDGGTGTGASVSHTYQFGGIYEASLVVIDDDGARSVPSRLAIRVIGAPPGPPTGLAKTAEGYGPFYQNYRWDQIPGASEYGIEVRVDGGFFDFLCPPDGSGSFQAPTGAGRVQWSGLISSVNGLCSKSARIRVRAGSTWSNWSNWIGV